MEMSVQTRNFYDKIKPRLHWRIGRRLRPAGRVLDVGCGSCDLVRHLADTYRQAVTGVDISQESFPHERQTAHGMHYDCRKTAADRLGFLEDMSVDAAVTMWALHEMDRPLVILKEIRRVLRPGGLLLVVDFPPQSLAYALWHEDYYSCEWIRRTMYRAGFSDVEVRLIEGGQLTWGEGFRPAGCEPAND